MSIRETIDRNKGATGLVAVIAILAAGGWMFWSNAAQLTQRVLTTRMFYTADEGKTWFVDDAEQIPPFDYKGQTAYRVRLFSCQGGKAPFAGYLERYTADAAKRLAAAKRGDAAAAGIPQGRPMLSLVDELAISGTEIKKPGPGNPWVRRADLEAARAILDVRCPNGEAAEAVMP